MLTLEQAEAEIARHDADPSLGSHVNEPTKGEWMLARESLLREQEEILKQSGLVFLAEDIPAIFTQATETTLEPQQ